MVEWKKLGEVCVVHTGGQLNRNDMIEEGLYPVINGGKTPSGYTNSFNERANSITISQGGESAGYVNWIDTDFWAGAHCYVVEHDDNIVKRYLYHTLKNIEVVLQSVKQGAGIPGLNRKTLYKQVIPIPTKSEQSRIVGILDTFTASIANLKAQIKERRKQYEYYRDQLLDLEGKEGVEMKTLGEVGEIRGRIGFRGYTREDQVGEGEGVLSLSPGNIVNGIMDYNNSTYITWQKYEESPEIKIYDGDIIFCKTGSTVGKVSIVSHLPYKATINPQLVVLKEIKINSNFLLYTLGTYRIQSLVKALAGVGSVPNISQAKLNELIIPLPSKQEQLRIVSILDQFEASIANLEAQLKEREKQYEYYRNQLLTFE
ncbi:MAG: restriction endonuclease subunit S [Bacteroidaceae bacterium]|nr:restriction endonuclease subunit S [Bacteroidaceae bacterium]